MSTTKTATPTVFPEASRSDRRTPGVLGLEDERDQDATEEDFGILVTVQLGAVRPGSGVCGP
ncbi:hypothetical protein [Streptomyces sp. NPDC002133]|uniref:hypothetical protein n=1 Tax=Streptomyces sp. NPDC002133 TaxID=3154409 RepID=UPI00333105F5